MRRRKRSEHKHSQACSEEQVLGFGEVLKLGYSVRTKKMMIKCSKYLKIWIETLDSL
jgi:hypothetical protein